MFILIVLRESNKQKFAFASCEWYIASAVTEKNVYELNFILRSKNVLITAV